MRMARDNQVATALKSQGEGAEISLSFFAAWRLGVIIAFETVDNAHAPAL
jgi:hypothetical protein